MMPSRLKQPDAVPWPDGEPLDLPWGDYLDTLYSGVCLGWTPQGEMRYGRAVPFVPSFMFPFGGVLIRDDVRERLASAGLGGWAVRAVSLERAVRIDWQRWRQLKAPRGGEPIAYITARKDAPIERSRVGRLWQLIPECTMEPGEGIDFFGPRECVIFCSPRAAEWLTANYRGEVSLREGQWR
ncbi:MAG: hypothetical protein KDC38_02170 [Planctomycetes bacterium]|nr:hypothetical protein [Planctomycetota bacterium]